MICNTEIFFNQLYAELIQITIMLCVHFFPCKLIHIDHITIKFNLTHYDLCYKALAFYFNGNLNNPLTTNMFLTGNNMNESVHEDVKNTVGSILEKQIGNKGNILSPHSINQMGKVLPLEAIFSLKQRINQLALRYITYNYNKLICHLLN